MNPDALARLISLAFRQGSLVLREQALEIGFSRSTIERKVRSGEWQDLGGSVLLLGAVRPDGRQRLRAATLRLRDCVVSHETAGAMHGFNYVPSDVLSVCVPVRSTHRFPGVAVREVTDMRSTDVTEVGGLPVTSPVRTAFDLASVLRPGRYERVVEDALAAGRFDILDLHGICFDLGRRGKPGTALARKTAEKFGFGLVAAQFCPPWWEGAEGVVDFAYPDSQVIFELDGRRWHTRDSTREDDLRRDNRAALHHWRVFRFTWDQVVNHPDYVIATIVTALGLAA
jgi:hypothetical protein